MKQTTQKQEEDKKTHPGGVGCVHEAEKGKHGRDQIDDGQDHDRRDALTADLFWGRM